MSLLKSKMRKKSLFVIIIRNISCQTSPWSSKWPSRMSPRSILRYSSSALKTTIWKRKGRLKVLWILMVWLPLKSMMRNTMSLLSRESWRHLISQASVRLLKASSLLISLGLESQQELSLKRVSFLSLREVILLVRSSILLMKTRKFAKERESECGFKTNSMRLMRRVISLFNTLPQAQALTKLFSFTTTLLSSQKSPWSKNNLISSVPTSTKKNHS